MIYRIACFFEWENSHEFHESIVIHENFTFEIFTLGIRKVLFKCFKVDKHMKEDHCFAQIWPHCYLKEGNVQGWENRYSRKVPNAADHTSL